MMSAPKPFTATRPRGARPGSRSLLPGTSAFVALLCLLSVGCADRRSDDAAPEPHAPTIRLMYEEQRGHDPGGGILRATVRDSDRDLATATLMGPSVAVIRHISGGFDTLTASVRDLPEGEHLYVGTATDHGGRTHTDTLTIRIDPNDPPPATLSVTGEGSEWRLVQGVAVDPQGDPVEYTIVVEGPISFTIGPRAAPTDTTLTLQTGKYHLSSVTSDKHRADTTTYNIDVVVKPPTATQSVERKGVVLRYRADVRAAYATLTVTRDPDDVFYHGTVPLDTTFAGLTRGDDSGLPKGNYSFRLYGERHGHSLDETVWARIIDLNPSVDLSHVNASFDEGGQTVVPLPVPRDPNQEDHPTYTRATSLDGKVTVDLTDSKLTLEAVADSTGPFRVELIVGDATTGTRADTLEATIRPLPTAAAAATAGDTTGSKSGYETVVAADGGASSVGADLVSDDKSKHPILHFDFAGRWFTKYYGFKRRLKDAYGFAFGIDYTILNQYSNFSTTDTQAASGIFRLFGEWKLRDQKDGPSSRIVWRVENRHLVGKGITPRDLGFDGGSILSTATFSAFDWGLTALYWKQRFGGGRFSFVAGRMPPGDYSDTYSLLSSHNFFMSDAFSHDRSVALPKQGIGVAARILPLPIWYVMAGVHDANGSPTELGLRSFFEVREYYTWIETGWAPSGTPLGGQSVHLNLWHQDPREAKGTEEAWGVTFSANKKFTDRWNPFLRAGISRGKGGQQIRFLLAGGTGIIIRVSDFLGVATSWSGAVDSALRDQFTSELFYRLQLTQHVAVTPEIQFTMDPSKTTATDYLTVASVLRLRVSF